ncbi:MAG TPA: DUF952 domain-containing protein [Brevundimonas sp.]|nr:DUF952 domain-containing protein [Brevundimonas sp.]
MTVVAYKLLDRLEWDGAQASGRYDGSAVDRADGYIHMSTADQLAETARRHYRDRPHLVLLEVTLEALGPGLKWEASRGGARFPHLYGPLPASAVRHSRTLSVDAAGVMQFDDGGPAWG